MSVCVRVFAYAFVCLRAARVPSAGHLRQDRGRGSKGSWAGRSVAGCGRPRLAEAQVGAKSFDELIGEVVWSEVIGAAGIRRLLVCRGANRGGGRNRVLVGGSVSGVSKGGVGSAVPLVVPRALWLPWRVTAITWKPFPS